MKKPEAPRRPTKPSRSTWEKSKRNRKKRLSLKSDRKSSISLQQIVEFASKLNPEDLKIARLKGPTGRGWAYNLHNKGPYVWPWEIQIDDERTEEDLEKMWSAEEAQHEIEMNNYRKLMKAYKDDLEKWRDEETRRIEKKYHEEIKKLKESK